MHRQKEEDFCTRVHPTYYISQTAMDFYQAEIFISATPPSNIASTLVATPFSHVSSHVPRKK